MTDNEINKLKQKNKTLTNTVREADDVIDNLRHEVFTLKKKITTLENDIETKTKHINKLNIEINIITRDFVAIQDVLKNTKTEFVLKTEVQDYNENKKEIINLRKKLQELQKEYIKCCEDKNNNINKLKELNEYLVNKQKQNDVIKTTYMSLEYELNYTRLQQEFEAIKNERDSLLTQLRTTKRQNVTLTCNPDSITHNLPQDKQKCCCTFI